MVDVTTHIGAQEEAPSVEQGVATPCSSNTEKFFCHGTEETSSDIEDILRKDEKKQADADFLEKKIDEMVERLYGFDR